MLQTGKRLAFMGAGSESDPWLQSRIVQAVIRSMAKGTLYYSVDAISSAGQIAGIQLGHMRRYHSFGFMAVSLSPDSVLEFSDFLTQNGSSAPDQFFVLPKAESVPEPLHKLNLWQLDNADAICWIGPDIGFYFEEVADRELPVLQLNPEKKEALWFIHDKCIPAN